MVGALLPGDRLLVIPAVKWKKGDLVAARDPRRPERLIVKRLSSLNDDGFDLRGDNPPASTDSRHFGPVPRSLVLGKVVYRYAPAARAGWINRLR
jgi:nickel-type superoxide dismutase maturation protease